jgi:hypothetical protein
MEQIKPLLTNNNDPLLHVNILIYYIKKHKLFNNSE